MKLSRRTALLLAAATCAGTAGPALAAPETAGVGVTLSTTSAGTRQFHVLQADTTAPLATLDLTGGAQTFRTRVSDTNFEALGRNYSVSATMSNLYLKTGSTHDVATKIPSSQLSMSKAALSVDPLLDLNVLPALSFNGTLPACSALDSSTKTLLGLGTASNLADVLTAATGPVLNLCTALGAAGKPVTGQLDGVVQTVQATVNDVTKLPNALTAGALAQPNPFAHADYGHDAVAQTDPARDGAPTATAVNIMSGAAGVTLPTDLVTTVKDALTGRLSSLPFVSPTGAGALATTNDVVSGLGDSTLAGLLGALSAEQQTALLNTVTSTALSVADPVLSRVKISAKYYGKPTLSVNLDAPVSGTYDGTMTLTFVQN